jgi:hypothetical protein
MNLCWFLCLIFDCFKYIFFSSDWFFTVESYFYHYKPTENILIQHLVHIVLLHYKIQSCHNIAEILLKLVLNTNKKINQYRIQYNVHGIAVVSYSTLSNLNLSIWSHLFSFFFVGLIVIHVTLQMYLSEDISSLCLRCFLHMEWNILWSPVILAAACEIDIYNL